MSLLLLAAALLVLPSAEARRRLAGPRRGARWKSVKPNRVSAVVVGIALGLPVGVGGAIAGALLAATVWRTYREAVRQRDRMAASVALADGLKAFVAELRSGAHPAKAAIGAAEDAEPPATDVLRAIAATSARGGDVEAALADFPDARHLARAWRLSAVHGVPLADVLDAVRRDLDRRTAFAGQVHARMAGPRAGAAVLAGLPLFGVVLGELGGARPLAVLSGTPPGQVLLVAGVVLICVGLRWSGRLTRQVIA
ncbi:type II secretion system protein [Saccharothrix sp. NRRL B-16348]|uniref:type II secretion system F family protein n=1 Tax=Saccharothrix sp. NRRL B-16348 TaxID=1415542 RepID=UPI0006AEEED1|nr:type II secretion system F family protein [Saccharothrix sp. NRRL B-16348]KOX31670.1 type II secretion system protein [Saccharothrix sp. NRRL B-16348]